MYKARTIENWDTYFLNLCESVKSRSKDPSRQVGCVIVDESNRVVSTGYNGFPKKCKNDFMTYIKPFKYAGIIHAELNALLKTPEPIKNCRMYVSNAPCDNCLKHILVEDIHTVIYDNAEIMKKNASTETFLEIRRLIKSSNIKIISKTGISYIEDLRSAFPEELAHPDGLEYSLDELKNENHYIVKNDLSDDTFIVFLKDGVLYNYDFEPVLTKFAKSQKFIKL